MKRETLARLAKSRAGKVAIVLIIANEIRGAIMVGTLVWQTPGLLTLVGGR